MFCADARIFIHHLPTCDRQRVSGAKR